MPKSFDDVFAELSDDRKDQLLHDVQVLGAFAVDMLLNPQKINREYLLNVADHYGDITLTIRLLAEQMG